MRTDTLPKLGPGNVHRRSNQVSNVADRRDWGYALIQRNYEPFVGVAKQPLERE